MATFCEELTEELRIYIVRFLMHKFIRPRRVTITDRRSEVSE